MHHLNYQENGATIGKLSLQPMSWFSRLRLASVKVLITTADTPDRRRAETLIKRIYQKVHDASITVQYPVLISIENHQKELIAALGYRPAHHGPLYLEHYLSGPIEEILHTPRARIVEIGNLASTDSSASLFLFIALCAYLHHQEFTQAVITCSNKLEARFKAMGLAPQRLTAAKPHDLLHTENTQSIHHTSSVHTKKQDYWGHYYRSNPHVLSGSVTQGFQHLQHRLGADYKSYTQP